MLIDIGKVRGRSWLYDYSLRYLDESGHLCFEIFRDRSFASKLFYNTKHLIFDLIEKYNISVILFDSSAFAYVGFLSESLQIKVLPINVGFGSSFKFDRCISILFEWNAEDVRSLICNNVFRVFCPVLEEFRVLSGWESRLDIFYVHRVGIRSGMRVWFQNFDSDLFPESDRYEGLIEGTVVQIFSDRVLLSYIDDDFGVSQLMLPWNQIIYIGNYGSYWVQ